MRVGILLLTGIWIVSAAMLAQKTNPAASARPDPAAMLSGAQSLYRKGSFDQALAGYNEVLKADPASGDAYAGIIRCYLKQDKVREADDALRKGLLANPGHADLKVAEGELLFRQGEFPEAGALFDEVIGTDPPNARAYLGAARVAAASAMYAREHILVMRAHEIDPSDPDVRKIWMQTLSIAERIKSLEDYLGQTTNDDADTRRTLKERLDFLKASQFAQSGRCRLVSDVTSTETNLIPLQSRNGNVQGIGLQVTINGQDSKLLLDTGTSGILITSKLAGQAGLKPVADIRISGVGDKPDLQAHLESANSVRIGKLEFQNCPVHVVDRLTATDDGIIGADVFSQFLIEMDFPSSTLRLSELPSRPGEAPSKASLKTGDEEPTAEPEAKPSAEPGVASQSKAWTTKYVDRDIAPEMHSYVQAFHIGHMLLVPTRINEGPEKLFLLDTGSFDNTIALDAAKEVTKVHRAPRIDIRGVNGEVNKVYVADQVVLDFGHLRQTVPNMVAFDMSRISHQAGTEISGTLGMVMLRLLKVRLDYRDALADFQYVQPRPRH
ncbi:MAG: aspartyl protease family protein [Candidatus Sulfotelmatobacter sp.]